MAIQVGPLRIDDRMEFFVNVVHLIPHLLTELMEGGNPRVGNSERLVLSS